MRAAAVALGLTLAGPGAGPAQAEADPRLQPMMILPETTLADACRNGAILIRWQRWLAPPAEPDPATATVEEIVASIMLPGFEELSGRGCIEDWLYGFLTCSGDPRHGMFLPPATEAATLALMRDCLIRFDAMHLSPVRDSDAQGKP